MLRCCLAINTLLAFGSPFETAKTLDKLDPLNHEVSADIQKCVFPNDFLFSSFLEGLPY